MARSLTLGNGKMLVALDEHAFVRDLYFPHIGLENHVGGHFCHRIGIFVDGSLSWLDNGDWRIDIKTPADTFVGETHAVNSNIGVELSITDAVYNERNIFIRRVSVKNTRGVDRRIKVFFAHEFEIYESHRGDTAYFDPHHRTIIHYKGRRVFLVNARSKSGGFDEYTTGIFGIEGKEGSFKDAEDGILSGNAIEHGLTDSVIGVSLHVPASGEDVVHYWLVATEFIADAHAQNQYVLERTPEYIIESTKNFWHAWIGKYNFHLGSLPEDVGALFLKSLFIIRAHADDGGAILASTDSGMLQGGKDTYGYMWPRDAAIIAEALIRAGDANVGKRFLEFANRIITEDGYFLHKYRPDESPGSSWHPWIRNGRASLPIQEDSTAHVLRALKVYYEHTKDLEFVESVYNNLIKRAGTFLLFYRSERLRLPEPSFDLWEEKYGVHTYTASAVVGALRVASDFASLLGKEANADSFRRASDEIKNSIIEHLFDQKRRLFRKSVNVIDGGAISTDDTIDMSSPYGVFNFGVLSSDDDRLIDAFNRTVRELTIGTPIGGIARYSGDNYYKTRKEFPGNPWCITTLWDVRFRISRAKTIADFRPIIETLRSVARRATHSGILAEQYDPVTGAPLSATPLAWSHAEYVLAVLDYLDRLEILGLCDDCNPVE